jgi:hypothetical protein
MGYRVASAVQPRHRHPPPERVSRRLQPTNPAAARSPHRAVAPSRRATARWPSSNRGRPPPATRYRNPHAAAPTPPCGSPSGTRTPTPRSRCGARTANRKDRSAPSTPPGPPGGAPHRLGPGRQHTGRPRTVVRGAGRQGAERRNPPRNADSVGDAEQPGRAPREPRCVWQLGPPRTEALRGQAARQAGRPGAPRGQRGPTSRRVPLVPAAGRAVWQTAPSAGGGDALPTLRGHCCHRGGRSSWTFSTSARPVTSRTRRTSERTLAKAMVQSVAWARWLMRTNAARPAECLRGSAPWGGGL